jgi:hypothetical protein
VIAGSPSKPPDWRPSESLNCGSARALGAPPVAVEIGGVGAGRSPLVIRSSRNDRALLLLTRGAPTSRRGEASGDRLRGADCWSALRMQ